MLKQACSLEGIGSIIGLTQAYLKPAKDLVGDTE